MAGISDDEMEKFFAGFAAKEMRQSEEEDDARESAFQESKTKTAYKGFASSMIESLEEAAESAPDEAGVQNDDPDDPDDSDDSDDSDGRQYAQELDEVGFIHDLEDAEAKMRQMMGFLEFDCTTVEKKRESIRRWLDERTKGMGEKAREKAKVQLLGVYNFVFNDLLPKFHEFFKDNRVKAKEMRPGPGIYR